MFVTMVEGLVEPDREQDLRDAWAEETSGQKPAGLLETFLVRADDGVWRIVTVWESRDAVLAMREAGPPAALVMFQRAGAQPTVAMGTVEGHVRVWSG